MPPTPVFAVDHVLISDDLLDAPFACDLAACHGACCVQGNAGAPLLESEIADMVAVYPVVASMLTPAARRVVAAQGVWEETAPGHFNTSCVEDRGHSGACVFVTYERGPRGASTALCAIEKAGRAGKTAIEKPISCHLYPIRVERYDDLEVLNYEQIPLCEGGRRCGTRASVELADFLAAPLTRAYGADWVARFHDAIVTRRADLGMPPRPDPLAAAIPPPSPDADGFVALPVLPATGIPTSVPTGPSSSAPASPQPPC